MSHWSSIAKGLSFITKISRRNQNYFSGSVSQIGIEVILKYCGIEGETNTLRGLCNSISNLLIFKEYEQVERMANR